MNRIFVKFFCLAAFSFVSIIKAQTASVFIQPVEQNINVSSTTYISVSISDVSDIRSFSITIYFGNTLIEITEVNELDFFSQHSTMFLWNVYLGQGKLIVDASIYGVGSQSGSGDLFEVEILALGSGVADLSLQDIILRDSENNDIPFTSENGSITINPVTSIDEKNDQNEFVSKLSNYPNPFNNSTVINYYSTEGKIIEFKVFSILGVEVYSQLDNSMITGDHKFYWNGKNQFGNSLPSGVYLISVSENDKIVTKKITFLK
jgi:hypothetical protein